MSHMVVELPSSPQALGRPREIPGRDWDRYRGNVAEILEAFGLPPGMPGTRETPERFLRALFDATAGYDGDAKLVTMFPTESDTSAGHPPAQVVEGPIAFYALCEHHALPFYGQAYIGYVPSERIIGISKLTRLVRLFARRFTVQERLGEQIADTLRELAEPQGVAIKLVASHLCTHMRGVEERSETTTTAWRGVYESADLRREFLDLVR